MIGRTGLTSIALLAALWPATAFAQGVSDGAKGVGVVTTIAGTATVARAALPSPRPLQFKDDVFVRDRIATAERSVVRLLLGGKALVTVRELSALTITEETGRATVDLTAGKIAMGVLRQRMRPGEVIEIRTPNAIAAIRGTVLVVELIPEPGGAPGAAPRYTTKVHVLHGLVEVSDPNNPSAPPAQVGTLESWSRSGSEPFSQVPLTPAAVERVFADLHSPPQIAAGPSELVSRVTQREQAQAAVLAEYLAPETDGGGDGGPSSTSTSNAQSTDAPMVAQAPVVPTVPNGSSGPGGSSSGLTGLARFSYNSQTVGVAGSLYSLSGSATDAPAVPILEAANSSLSLGANLMEVTGGSTFASAGAAPLLYLDPSTLSAASILNVSGSARFGLVGSLFHDQQGVIDWTSDAVRLSGGASVVGAGASALVDLVGSTATTAGSLISVSGGAMMDLLSASAPLLSLTRGATLTTGRSLVDLSGGAAVQLSQMTALTASSLTITGHGVSLSNASLNVAGDLFRLANGSTLTFTNGALVSLNTGASLNVTGALINFIGTGNTVSITNNLCAGGGCTTVSGLRVLLSGGGSLSLASPILNLTGNTLNVSPDAAVISVTGGARVRQGP